MIEYKGISVPRDIPLFFIALYKIFVYRTKIAKYPIGKILSDVRSKRERHLGTRAKEETLLRLKKLYRLAGFLLVRVMRSTKPCLIRSLIVFEEAVKRGLPVEIRIGVKPEQDALAGHSWIAIEGRPFIESETGLENYTVMLSESNE